MRGRTDMLRTFRKRWFGMLLSVAAGLIVSVTVASAWSVDLELPETPSAVLDFRGRGLSQA